MPVDERTGCGTYSIGGFEITARGIERES